jgi:hypothetical protein
MCYVTGRASALDSSINPIRALHSITAAQVDSIEAALRRMPGSWSLDQQDGYDGDLTLILTLLEHPADLSFALWRTPAGYHLTTMRDDEQISCDMFASIEEVLAQAARSTEEVGFPV